MIIATTGTADPGGTMLVYHGPYREIIPRMAAAGYQAAEMHILDSAVIDRAELWGLLKSSGMVLTSIGTGAVYGRNGWNLVDREPEVRRAAIRHLEQHMVTAQPDQAVVILGLMVGQRKDCPDPKRLAANLEESLYQLDRLAAAYDVRLGLELTNRYERDFLIRIAEGVDYLRDHDFKRIWLHIDTVHMNIEEADIRAAILGGKGYIGHVHVADNDRWYPGHGHYPFRETLQALQDIGYDGALALETNGLPTEAESARKSLDYLTALINKLQ